MANRSCSAHPGPAGVPSNGGVGTPQGVGTAWTDRLPCQRGPVTDQLPRPGPKPALSRGVTRQGYGDRLAYFAPGDTDPSTGPTQRLIPLTA